MNRNRKLCKAAAVPWRERKIPSINAGATIKYRVERHTKREED